MMSQYAPVRAATTRHVLHPSPETMQLIHSSEGLGWDVMKVRTYLEPATAEQWTSASTPDLKLLLLAHGTMYMEQRGLDSAWHPYTIDQGSLILRPPGRDSYDLRWTTDALEPVTFVHVYLSADLLLGVASEMDADPARIEVVEQIGFEDQLLAQIGQTLATGLDQSLPADAFYAQSASRLLAAHIIRHYTAARHLPAETAYGLTRRQLQQVGEFVNAHLQQDLSVEVLAQQTGYSPYHFTRLFRQATDQSPYQFVLQQRVAHARQLLRESDMPVAEIALVSGFANQSHLTRMFRRMLGTTPRQARLAEEGGPRGREQP